MCIGTRGGHGWLCGCLRGADWLFSGRRRGADRLLLGSTAKREGGTLRFFFGWQRGVNVAVAVVWRLCGEGSTGSGGHVELTRDAAFDYC